MKWAVSLPSAMAQTTRDWPRAISPAANIPGYDRIGGNSIGVKKGIIIAAAVVLLTIGTTVGVGAYFVIQLLSHPPEDTAKFLPMETSFYVSLNLRPGPSQLLKIMEIKARFEEHARYDQRLEEYLDEIEQESGIDVREDLFPWLGPEIAFAITSVEGINDVPAMVSFIGTTDTAAAESLVRKLIAFTEQEENIAFQEGAIGDHITFSYAGRSQETGAHIALTEDYIVVASTPELLESTLGMMDSKGQTSLLDKPGFQKARDAAESPRFAILYADIAGVIDQAGEDLDPSELEPLRVIGDQLPDFIVVSSAFIDMGLRISTTFNTPEQSFALSAINSLGSAGLLPEDTLALISFVGISAAWEEFSDQYNRIGEPIGLEDLLAEFEAETGIDLDNDIFRWMTGEFALALLPSEFRLGSFGDPETSVIHANAFVEFDDREEAQSGLDKIVAALTEQGIEFTSVDIGGIDAMVVDLEEMRGVSGYKPGYMILENYVVLGTTLESLQQAVDLSRDDIVPLEDASAFTRPILAAGDSTDAVVYANIRQIVATALDVLDEPDREQYEEDAEPFVSPVEAVAFGYSFDEEDVTFSIVVTFE